MPHLFHSKRESLKVHCLSNQELAQTSRRLEGLIGVDPRTRFFYLLFVSGINEEYGSMLKSMLAVNNLCTFLIYYGLTPDGLLYFYPAVILR